MDLSSLDPRSFGAVDLLLVAVLLLGLWRGWRVGFVAGVVELACLAAGLVVAFFASPWLAALLERYALLPEPWASPAAFLVIFLVVQVVLGSFSRRLARPLPAGSAGAAARSVNRALGLLPGAANGAINAMVVAVLLTALPLTDGITRAAQDSALVARLGVPADWLAHRLGPIFDPAVERTMQALTVQPQSQERVALPFVVKDAPPRPELEAAMLTLVNAERTKASLRPLAADTETVDLSRAHSRDMFERSYFAHVTPEGRTPFDRLRTARLSSRAAGENLALARTLDMAHTGLMNSPGHRANILNPAFGRVGIGIVDGGRHGLMVTQTFRSN
ncbi:CvpA family protein [Variovorax sp. ZT4R33]|uniref:CvpA family protein n=1 Tax=Variovorax sp. ZT4R33 TaxID=3443743 RepID=UPI003F48CBA7